MLSFFPMSYLLRYVQHNIAHFAFQEIVLLSISFLLLPCLFFFIAHFLLVHLFSSLSFDEYFSKCIENGYPISASSSNGLYFHSASFPITPSFIPTISYCAYFHPTHSSAAFIVIIKMQLQVTCYRSLLSQGLDYTFDDEGTLKTPIP